MLMRGEKQRPVLAVVLQVWYYLFLPVWGHPLSHHLEGFALWKLTVLLLAQVSIQFIKSRVDFIVEVQLWWRIVV